MTTAEQQGVRVRDIRRVLTRAVILAPDQGLHDSGVAWAVPFILRPRSSNSAPYAPALPGGKIEKKDLVSFISEEERENDDFVISFQLLCAVAAVALCREIAEELEITITTEALSFISDSLSGGWRTLSFFIILAQKPKLAVTNDTAGIIWLHTGILERGSLPMTNGEIALNDWLLAGHLEIAQEGIQLADAAASET